MATKVLHGMKVPKPYSVDITIREYPLEPYTDKPYKYYQGIVDYMPDGPMTPSHRRACFRSVLFGDGEELLKEQCLVALECIILDEIEKHENHNQRWNKTQ